jgi:short-subunit dehydrogenase
MTKTALITGASRGIGYDLAKSFARQQHNLILVSRNEDRLNEIGYDLSERFNAEVTVIAADLSQDQAAIKVFNETCRRNLKVDILVNNAGIGDWGFFNDEDFDRISRMLHLNIIALTELTRLVLPQMIRAGEGRILNVSSLAAFVPGPYMAVYYASKAYVKSFSEAIGNELKGTGVTVTALCPGLTKTGFQKAMGGENTAATRFNMMASSESVAEYGIKALYDGKEIAVPGIINASIARTAQMIPDRIKSRIIRVMQEFNRKVF